MIKVNRCGIRMIYLHETEEQGSISKDFKIVEGLSKDTSLSNGSFSAMTCSEERIPRPRHGSSMDIQNLDDCSNSELDEEPEVINN